MSYEYGILKEPGSYSTSSNHYEMGWEFEVNPDWIFDVIQAHGIRVKLPVEQEIVANLWDSATKELLATVTIAATGADWCEGLFDAPIMLNRGARYTISCYNPSSRYYASASTCEFHESLKYITGRFISNKGVYPTSTETDKIYPMIDLVLIPRTPYNAYYLVQDTDTGKYYANKEGSLTEVPLTEYPELSDFVEHGGLLPTSGMLSTLPRFKILKCADTVEYPDLLAGVQYSIVGNLAPQLLKLKEPVRLTEQYQTGFKSVSFVSEKLETTAIKTLLSMDGVTWYRFNAATEGDEEGGVAATEASWTAVDYTAEAAVASGMTEEELALVDAEAFKLLYGDTGNNALYIAFVVECTALDHWLINSVRVEFTANK